MIHRMEIEQHEILVKFTKNPSCTVICARDMRKKYCEIIFSRLENSNQNISTDFTSKMINPNRIRHRKMLKSCDFCVFKTMESSRFTNKKTINYYFQLKKLRKYPRKNTKHSKKHIICVIATMVIRRIHMFLPEKYV